MGLTVQSKTLIERIDFTGNTENTPLTSASSRLDLNINQNSIDQTRDIENFEDGDFPALRPNYDRQAEAHHNSHRVAFNIRLFKPAPYKQLPQDD